MLEIGNLDMMISEIKTAEGLNTFTLLAHSELNRFSL